MSKNSSNDKILRVQFREPDHSEYFEVIKFFDKIYGKPKRADNVRLALRDFKILFDFLHVRTFEGLTRRIGIEVRKNAKTS